MFLPIQISVSMTQAKLQNDKNEELCSSNNRFDGDEGDSSIFGRENLPDYRKLPQIMTDQDTAYDLNSFVIIIVSSEAQSQCFKRVF